MLRPRFLSYEKLIDIQSLTTASGSRLFVSVVEHWTFNLAARVLIPSKSWDCFSAICYPLFFITTCLSLDEALINMRVKY